MEKNSEKIYKIVMLVILTAFITFTITTVFMYKNIATGNLENIATSIVATNKNSNIESYLEKVRNSINKYYLWKDDIDEQKLKDEAIKGYVAGLGDEYTEYIPSSEMKNYTEQITGIFYGVGIYMVADEESNRVMVYYPIQNSPAEKAGIKAGDKIIKVDGTEYTAKDLSNISKYIKGKDGTKVNLTIERDGKQIDVELVREKISVNPIISEMLEDNIAYIRIPSFDEGVAKSFKEKYEELKNKGAKSLIIDLRNNGGGIVTESTEIADYILDKDNLIISTVDNKGNKVETKSKNDPIITTNIVILVNKNTASASEILASSLQENGKAKLIGNKTYGKGVIQTVLSLADGSGLKITTSEYYTAKGNKINKQGINPDREQDLPENVKSIYSLEKENDTQLKKAIEELKNK